MIQSLERAFDILELLDCAGPAGMGLQDIGREVGLKLPTVHNMLKTMTFLGYVTQDSSSAKYRTGDKLRALGMQLETKRAFSEVAEPLARRLNKDVNETVTVTLYANRTWHTLFQIYSEQELSVRASLPVNKNLFISATGRCILSGLPKGELEKYLNTSGMPREDWDNINDFAHLRQALDKIKERGYEIYRRRGSLGIGVPLRLVKRGIDAAIGIYMPESRFEGKHGDAVINALQNTAEEIRTIMEK
ncbi:MAG TPA: hypothetical protein DCZ94_18955 [Lentisphaeria bacterium]|nr:MAG: hypothetical protein A2X48_08765 [Lentisphaerae bacterium GWF2_49_21]HBC89024.1 hypothetical protein [Lentisphaeria bacterium]